MGRLSLGSLGEPNAIPRVLTRGIQESEVDVTTKAEGQTERGCSFADRGKGPPAKDLDGFRRLGRERKQILEPPEVTEPCGSRFSSDLQNCKSKYILFQATKLVGFVTTARGH